MDHVNAQWGVLSSVFGMHPQYSEAFEETMNTLFKGESTPLSLSCRHFVGLMAACRHQCKFLIDVHKDGFLKAGGDPNWLTGKAFQNVPQKFKDLDLINRQLAHRPWTLAASTIQELTKAGSTGNWSLTELVISMVLLCHSHSLSSFIHGCGIVGECSSISGSAFGANNLSANGCIQNGISTMGENEVEMLLARLQEINESECESSQEDKIKHFVDINLQNSEICTNPNGSAANETCAGLDVCQFTEDLEFCYCDFAKRNEASAAPTMKIHEYCWDDQGFSQLDQISQPISDCLDKKFSIIKNLTYKNLGSHENIETGRYREAIWNYIQCLFGIRHDDYDYAMVNKMLTRQMKTYIKIVCCFPEKTTKELRNSVMNDFQLSEKVHVNILIMEARLQSELLYGLRAVTRFKTSDPRWQSDSNQS